LLHGLQRKIGVAAFIDLSLFPSNDGKVATGHRKKGIVFQGFLNKLGEIG